MKLILVSIAILITGAAAFWAGSLMIFLLLASILGSELGWGVFFALLLSPVLVISLVLLVVLKKMYKRLVPASRNLSK